MHHRPLPVRPRTTRAPDRPLTARRRRLRAALETFDVAHRIEMEKIGGVARRIGANNERGDGLPTATAGAEEDRHRHPPTSDGDGRGAACWEPRSSQRILARDCRRRSAGGGAALAEDAIVEEAASPKSKEARSTVGISSRCTTMLRHGGSRNESCEGQLGWLKVKSTWEQYVRSLENAKSLALESVSQDYR